MPCCNCSTCDYTQYNSTSCRSSCNVADQASTDSIMQKRIWRQVRTGSGIYTMNLAALTGGAAILASGSNVNWNQRSDRVLASVQPAISSTRGNSLRHTITSHKPGAGSPGGSGVDVKHDSYARYLNKKKATNLKTQTQNVAPVALYGNKTSMNGLLANSVNCCVAPPPPPPEPSDRRLKCDIEFIGHSPRGVPIYYFKYIAKPEGPIYQGTMAQDLLELGFKEAVKKDTTTGMYMVDYSKIDVVFKAL
jgi:hypothetical protein